MSSSGSGIPKCNTAEISIFRMSGRRDTYARMRSMALSMDVEDFCASLT